MRAAKEKRHLYRIPDGRRALLRLRWGRRIVMELEQVSAEGFTLLSDKQMALKPNRQYDLRTSAGWSTVRLVHWRQEGDRYRYGLERVEDQPDPRADRRVLEMSGAAGLRHKPPREKLAGVGYFLVLAFAVAVFYYYSMR